MAVRLWLCAEERQQSETGLAFSVADLSEGDHEQVLQALAYHLYGEIGPVTD